MHDINTQWHCNEKGKGNAVLIGAGADPMLQLTNLVVGWNLLRTEDVHLHMPALRIGTHFLPTLETVVSLSSFKHHLKTFLFSFY